MYGECFRSILLGFDGEGYERCLIRKQRLIGGIILIEARYDAVAIFGNQLVQSLLMCSYPVFPFFHGICVGAQLLADVEVAVSQRHSGGVHHCPVVVHSEGPQKHLAVLFSQLAVERLYALCLQFQEHRVYELHHIEIPHLVHLVLNLHEEPCTAHLAGCALEVDVAWIVFPEVAVARYDHLIAKRSQTFCECCMHVAVFAKE